MHCAKDNETGQRPRPYIFERLEVHTMKNWQRYLILTGMAMSQTLCEQDIQAAAEALR